MVGTDWTHTNTGLNKLASRINLEGNNIYYVPEEWEIKDMTDKQRANLGTKTNPDGSFAYRILLTNDDTFYAEGSLKRKYGIKIINYIEKVLNMIEEDEDEDDIDNRALRIHRRIAQTKGMSYEETEKEAHNIFKEYTEHGFDYTPSRRKPYIGVKPSNPVVKFVNFSFV